MSAEERVLVLDTSGWIVLFGSMRYPDRSVSEWLVTTIVSQMVRSATSSPIPV